LVCTSGYLSPSEPRILTMSPISLVYVPTERLGTNVTAATNTHATKEELLDASFSKRSVSYERKVGD
jgi:hypothetical protein